MSENVVYLPPPKQIRSQSQQLGLYLRIGRNQHRDMLDILAEGDSGFVGIIIDAQNTVRH